MKDFKDDPKIFRDFLECSLSLFDSDIHRKRWLFEYFVQLKELMEFFIGYFKLILIYALFNWDSLE